MKKEGALFQLLKEGHRIYIATQPRIFKELTISNEIEPYVLFFDCLLEKNRDWYDKKISELNKRVFGSLSMPTAAWIDHHFGIACGVTLGFLDSSGEPISMTRFARKFEEDSIHEWTMMVSPQHEGRGFGRATLALECELSKNKKRISFTTQLDNSAVPLYLGLTNEGNPLELLAIGFHHTHSNSIMAVAQIPKDSEIVMKEHQMPLVSEGVLLTSESELLPRKYLIGAVNLNVVKKISEDLDQGSKYKIIGWYRNCEEMGIKEPLTMIEKSAG